MLTNEHYRYFVRMNNRKKSHRVEDYIKNGYFIIHLPKGLKPISQELVNWLNSNIGHYAWTSDRWSLIAFTSEQHCTFFQLTWGGEVLSLKRYNEQYGVTFQ